MLDLVIDDALVVDGSGDRPFEGTVGLDGDRIAWVGRRGAVIPEAAATIDAKGAAIAPGFIDVHNHADLSALVLPEMPSVVRQGVTTVVVGNCGLVAVAPRCVRSRRSSSRTGIPARGRRRTGRASVTTSPP